MVIFCEIFVSPQAFLYDDLWNFTSPNLIVLVNFSCFQLINLVKFSITLLNLKESERRRVIPDLYSVGNMIIFVKLELDAIIWTIFLPKPFHFSHFLRFDLSNFCELLGSNSSKSFLYVWYLWLVFFFNILYRICALIKFTFFFFFRNIGLVWQYFYGFIGL